MQSASPLENLNAAQLDDELLAWLALVLSPGLGPRRIVEAVKLLKSAAALFTLALTELESLRFPAASAQLTKGT